MEEGEGQNDNSGESDEAPPKVSIAEKKFLLILFFNIIIYIENKFINK